MATQDELAVLFERNLTIQQPIYVAPTPEPKEEPIIYYSSQHYHHSAHVARPSSEPPQTDQLTADIILSRHGINSSLLLPAQLELFKSADVGQQMRLVELWRICPPNNAGHLPAQDIGHWPSTTFEQEEAMAKVRYERQMELENEARAAALSHAQALHEQGMDSDTMSDSSTQGPLTPVQGGDSRWNTLHAAEPYMQSGYEALAAREYAQSAAPAKDVYSHFGNSAGGIAYNHSTDPVYKTVEDVHKFPNVGGDWEALMLQRQQAMENQYGHFSYGAAGAYHNGQDEEML